MNTLFSAILFSALNILWQGVLAILIVVGIIVAVTYLMQRASEKARAKKQNDNGADESDKQ